ncbi:MAG TPA: lysylphosphatidylglycerol synthase transmembrane domain-containing protein [Ktedonobacteraceae bacterium]|nr:lysylphosphatidylglycerol synthase transmembrane domain-containing protein [Ktedonobacteraceae bacterium]
MRRQHPRKTPFNDSSLTAEVRQKSTEERSVALEGNALQTSSESDAEINSAQLSLGKRLLNWRTLVPLAIVLGFLVYTAQKLHINPGQTWAAIRSANLAFFCAAFLIYYLSFPIRTLRWHLLLENVGYTSKSATPLPPFGILLEILFTSWFANAVVPAKLGDVYRAYLLRQEAGVSATRTFGTVLAERLLDLSVLLLLFLTAIIVSLHENLPTFLRAGLYLTLAIVVLGTIALFLLRLYRAHIRRFVPSRFQGYYDQLQVGTLGSFKRLPLLLPLTVIIWLCEAGRFFFIALALNLIPGSLLHIGAAAMFIALGEALLTIVPFTSGGIGLVESGMIGMLALFTPARNQAAAGVLLDRAISLLSVLVIGLIVFLIGSARRAARNKQKLDSFPGPEL